MDFQELTKFAREVNELSREKHWREDLCNFSETIALCHSELSKALEADRNGEPDYRIFATREGDPPVRPEGVVIELANCIIRILDWCGGRGVDIGGVIKAKHEYNKTQPLSHGYKKY